MHLELSALRNCSQCPHQVYRLGTFLGVVVAPGLTPEPLLWEGLDGHLVNHVVGQILETGDRKGEQCQKCSVWRQSPWQRVP